MWNKSKAQVDTLATTAVVCRHEFAGCNQRFISLLCFNLSGDLLCSVGADDDHTLVLWNWQQGVALCHVQTQKERLFACSCNSLFGAGGAPASAFSGQLVLVGKGFARAYNAETLVEKRISTKLALPGRERAVAQLAVGFVTADVTVIASASGSLHFFGLEVRCAALPKPAEGPAVDVCPSHTLCNMPRRAGS